MGRGWVFTGPLLLSQVHRSRKGMACVTAVSAPNSLGKDKTQPL